MKHHVRPNELALAVGVSMRTVRRWCSEWRNGRGPLKGVVHCTCGPTPQGEYWISRSNIRRLRAKIRRNPDATRR